MSLEREYDAEEAMMRRHNARIRHRAADIEDELEVMRGLCVQQAELDAEIGDLLRVIVERTGYKRAAKLTGIPAATLHKCLNDYAPLPLKTRQRVITAWMEEAS